MSETVTCLIHGSCVEVSEKNDWTTFHIDIGRQYPVKLQTKKEEIIAEARAAGKEPASWKYQFSLGNENPRRPGERFKNRYLDAVRPGLVGTPTGEPDLDGSGGTPASSSSSTAGGSGPRETDENVDWDEKDRRDYSSRAWAQTISAFTHTIKTDEDPKSVFSRLQPFQRLVYADVTGAWGAERAQAYFPDALRGDPAPQTPQNSEPEPEPQDDYDPGPVDDDIPF